MITQKKRYLLSEKGLHCYYSNTDGSALAIHRDPHRLKCTAPLSLLPFGSRTRRVNNTATPFSRRAKPMTPLKENDALVIDKHRFL